MTDLAEHLPVPPPRRDDSDAQLAALIAHLCAFSVGATPRDVARPTRANAPAARARHLAMYLAHTALSWPLHRVGAAFGRDRSTAAYACARVEDLREDAEFDARLGELESWLRDTPRPRGLA